MDFFAKYVSNTTAGSGNQTFFTDGDGVGRVFYRLFCGGKFQYSLLFSNILDSTFADGSISRKNQLCKPWVLRHAAYCVTKDCSVQLKDSLFRPLTFLGKREKTVMPGEFFFTDEVEIEAEAGDYLCIEISFRGSMLPKHEEINIPTYVLKDGSFVPSKDMPVPLMVGCNRQVKKRVAYLGDSITQGIGTELNSYAHWNHRVSQMLGNDYAYWNLGIGYGRAEDAASDGAWLYKASQNDCVIVCFGVNDILQYADGEAIKAHLTKIIRLLKERGAQVILQTIPPFEYQESKVPVWRELNRYIREELSKHCDAVFDVVPILGQKEHPDKPRYGGHPNAEGCRAWAKALSPVVAGVLAE